MLFNFILVSMVRSAPNNLLHSHRKIKLLKYLAIAAVLLAIYGCNASTETDDADVLKMEVPIQVFCADTASLKQRANEDKLQISKSTSDQSKIVLGIRTNFYSLLGVIAHLRCVWPDDTEVVNLALQDALNAASAAESTNSFYVQVGKWNEANVAAIKVIAILVENLPPVASFLGHTHTRL